MKTINSKVYKDSVRWLGALEELIETMQVRVTVGGNVGEGGTGRNWERDVGKTCIYHEKKNSLGRII